MSVPVVCPSLSQPPIIGIDVAKDRLEVAVLKPQTVSAGRRPQPADTVEVATTVTGLGQLIDRLRPLAPALVVVEATGGYERPVVTACWAAELPVAIVNPRRVRWFAKSAGYGAKTDRLDALLLAHYALLTQPTPQAAPPASLSRLQALVRRREQLVGVLAGQRQQALHWKRDDATIHAGCLALIETLLADIAELDAQIATIVADDADLASLQQQVRSVPGVGPVVAATLLARLPELGQATDKELAALAGLAPYARESGTWTGERHITGGRTAVRRVLYLAVISGRRNNPVLRGLYERLRTAGKPVKVALVACARKLLTILNALVRTGSTWVDRTATT